MAKKLEKFEVNGVMLTANEKRVFEFAKTVEVVIPSEVAGKEPLQDVSVQSVRATLARLERTHGLVVGTKRLINDKPVAVYKVS